jgi:hypothetical protein
MRGKIWKTKIRRKKGEGKKKKSTSEERSWKKGE